MSQSRVCLAAVGFAAALAVAPMVPAFAQDYPTKSVKIVLPLPVGSALDVVTRTVAQELSVRLGQQVFVENRPGAGGLIAAQAVASATPDGYTLLGGASSIFTILPAQQEKLAIDVNRDFTQVGMIVGSGVMYIAVSPKLGVSSFAEFVALARSKPGEITIGTNGTGTLPYYAAMALAKVGNVPITVVPYAQGGTMAAVSDIMGGRVHATIEAKFGLRGWLNSGDLKLIGAMGPERDPELPGMATVAESVPGLTAVGFMSLAAPAGTPEPLVRRLSEELRQTLETPSVRQRFAELGGSIRIMTPAQTRAFIEGEQKYWLPLVRKLEAK